MNEEEVLLRDLQSMAAEVVAAFVSRNEVPAEELPALIETVYDSLEDLAEGRGAKPDPAVPIRQSVTRSHIVCLEDGKKFKTMKRHLRTVHNMSPAEYREKWGLRRDYPIVAPRYAAQRSELAKAAGLGRDRGRAPRQSNRKAA